MILEFDKRTLKLRLIVGTSEKYEPLKEVEEIQAKVDELREELEKFQSEVVQPKLGEIDSLVLKQNKVFQPQLAKKEEKE